MIIANVASAFSRAHDDVTVDTLPSSITDAFPLREITFAMAGAVIRTRQFVARFTEEGQGTVTHTAVAVTRAMSRTVTRLAFFTLTRISSVVFRATAKAVFLVTNSMFGARWFSRTSQLRTIIAEVARETCTNTGTGITLSVVGAHVWTHRSSTRSSIPRVVTDTRTIVAHTVATTGVRTGAQ